MLERRAMKGKAFPLGPVITAARLLALAKPQADAWSGICVTLELTDGTTI